MNSSYIEELVRSRQNLLALAEIRRTTGSATERKKISDEVRFQCCDWLRRLGFYKEGFSLALPSEPVRRAFSTRQSEGKRILWAARFLNLLGASEFAHTLLAQLELETEEDYRIAGSIQLAHFDFESARFCYERMFSQTKNQSGYSLGLARISLADTYAGLKQFRKSHALIKDVLKEAKEPLLQGIARQAQGEYFARQFDFNRARKSLDLASELIPAGENSVDRALLLKWRGYTLGMLGDPHAGKVLLDQAEKIFLFLQVRPEAWIDVLRLKSEIGVIPRAEFLKLIHYPGLSLGYKSLLPPPCRMTYGQDDDSRLKIYPDSQEFTLNGDPHYGLSLEMKLLSMLVIAADWGLDALKAKSLLWSHDVYSYAQMDNRLNQLLLRLKREFSFDTSIRGKRIRIARPTNPLFQSIQITVGASTHPVFFESVRGSFTRRDVESFYRLEKTRSHSVISDWLDSGYIVGEGRARSIRYRPTTVRALGFGSRG
jgi:tetratricopeptide (TPR) repeat protein